MSELPKPQGTMPRYIPISLALVAAMLLFLLSYGRQAWVMPAMRAAIELLTFGLIALSAGGYGYLVLRLIAPRAGATGLRAVTSVLIGLWLFATALLAGGVTVGLPGPMVCWSIMVFGGVLAGWQGRKVLAQWQIPEKFDGRSFYFILIGVAVALWLTGAITPPLGLGSSDVYDVLEYHLQVPREFHDAGGIRPLRHNAYSFYPLGMEMLFLGSMCLRGSAYEGMYLAKLMPGLLGGLAVAGMFFALKKDQPYRAYFSAGLLMTVPAAQYLGWIAFSELGMLAGLTLALLWLRVWWAEPSARSAAVLGVCIGVALTMKYLSVPFVALPIAVGMLGMCLAKPQGKRIAHWLLAGAVALVVFSPWLIRNAAATGNPVFPLMTNVFGQGHWSDEVAQRWQAGHAAQPHAPVPVPPGYQAPPPPDRLRTLWTSFLGSQSFGQISLILAAVAIAAMGATRDTFRKHAWDWVLAGTLGIQIVLWVQITRGMPWRFVAPAVVPISLLAGGALARLAAIRHSPFDKEKIPGKKEGWGIVPACGIFGVAVLVNSVVSFGSQAELRSRLGPIAPLPGQYFRHFVHVPAGIVSQLPEGSKTLLVGDAQAFYYPSNVLYATVFDNQPLGTDDLQKLRERGVTHVLVTWTDIWRLAGTYGFPAELSAELFGRWQKGEAPRLAILDRLGAKPVPILPPTGEQRDARAEIMTYPRPTPTSAPAQAVEDRSVWRPFAFPRTWPWATVYALPPEGAPADWEPEPIVLESQFQIYKDLGLVPPDAQPESQPASQPQSQPAK